MCLRYYCHRCEVSDKAFGADAEVVASELKDMISKGYSIEQARIVKGMRQA